jgi:hypothetical protein
MSMGWDYVSELRPETRLLFISLVIYYDADGGKLFTRPPEHSGHPTILVVSEYVGGMDETCENCTL